MPSTPPASLYVLSSVGSCGLEEVSAHSPGPKWFQLYVSGDRGYVRELIGRARSAGYLALVVTVDVQRAGGRERDRRNGFTLPPRVTAHSLAQGLSVPALDVDFLRVRGSCPRRLGAAAPRFASSRAPASRL